MIILINPDRLRKWEFTKRPKHLNGTYRNYSWQIYNIEPSNIFPDCVMYNLDIVSLKLDLLVYHSIHHTRNLSATVKNINRQIETLFYNDDH